MHFDEAQARGIAQRGDVVDAQAGVLHGFAHRDALGVALVQPFCLKSPTSAPEPRKVAALAFLLGEADHFQVMAGGGLAMQFPHARHGHEDAQPAVVLPPLRTVS